MKWWQRWAGLGIDLAKNILDDSQSPARLTAFLRSNLAITSPSDFHSRQEVAYAYDLVARLDLALNRRETLSPHPPLPSTSEFAYWRENLEDGRVISAAGLVPNTGFMLLTILDEPGHRAEFLQSQMERLLRRVEIRRSSALDTAGELDKESEWLERHAVAILFSRAARQTKDLRFLNAALKLNDWAYPSHRRLKTSPRLDRYLWSLAEQETGWKELLG